MRTEVFDEFVIITSILHVNPPEDFSATGTVVYVDLTGKTRTYFLRAGNNL
jgi:hypothetical protein